MKYRVWLAVCTVYAIAGLREEEEEEEEKEKESEQAREKGRRRHGAPCSGCARRSCVWVCRVYVCVTTAHAYPPFNVGARMRTPPSQREDRRRERDSGEREKETERPLALFVR